MAPTIEVIFRTQLVNPSFENLILWPRDPSPSRVCFVSKSISSEDVELELGADNLDL